MSDAELRLLAEILIITSAGVVAALSARQFGASHCGEFVAAVSGGIVGAVLGYEGLITPVAAILDSVYNGLANI